MNDEVTIQNLMDRLPEFFLPEKAGGIQAVVQFELSGEQGGEWTVEIGKNTCRVENARSESADLLFQASAQDVLDIFYDRLDPISALMQGRLRLKGNFGLAYKLFELFEVDADKLRQMRKK